MWNVRYRYLSSIFYILTWYEPKYKPSRRLSFRHLPSYFSALDGNNFNWSAIIPDTNWTLNSSVRYLWHFVRIRMRMRILGSVPLTNASWCLSRMAKIRGSGKSCDCCLILASFRGSRKYRPPWEPPPACTGPQTVDRTRLPFPPSSPSLWYSPHCCPHP